MAEPSLAAVLAHEPRGGLWRVVPLACGGVQPRPFYAVLRVVPGAHGPVVTWDGGASPEDQLKCAENRHLRGAEWIPCDARGERING